MIWTPCPFLSNSLVVGRCNEGRIASRGVMHPLNSDQEMVTTYTEAARNGHSPLAAYARLKRFETYGEKTAEMQRTVEND